MLRRLQTFFEFKMNRANALNNIRQQNPSRSRNSFRILFEDEGNPFVQSQTSSALDYYF